MGVELVIGSHADEFVAECGRRGPQRALAAS